MRVSFAYAAVLVACVALVCVHARVVSVPVQGFLLEDGSPAPYCPPETFMDETRAWCVHANTHESANATYTAARGPRRNITWESWKCGQYSCWSVGSALFTRNVAGVTLGYVQDGTIVSATQPTTEKHSKSKASPRVHSECAHGAYGESCEMTAVVCALNRCSNRGHCTGKVYGCECDPPYYGDCSTMRCLHGIGTEHGTCDCFKGYTGHSCDRLSKEMACTRSGGRYHSHTKVCECPASAPADETGACPKNPCGEGGRVYGFKSCKCLSGYKQVVSNGSLVRCESISAKPAGPYKSAKADASEALVGTFGAILLVGLILLIYFSIVSANMWRMRFYADEGEWEWGSFSHLKDR